MARRRNAPRSRRAVAAAVPAARRSRIYDLESGVGPLELGWLPHERDERRALVERCFRRHCAIERLDIGSVVCGEDDVVAPEEPVQGAIELVHPRGRGGWPPARGLPMKHCLRIMPDSNVLLYT